jgi:hypothetical protein
MPRQDTSNLSTTTIPSRILYSTPHAYYCGYSNTSIVHTRQAQPRHQHNTRPTIHTRCRNRPSPPRPRNTPRTNTATRTMASSITRLRRVYPSRESTTLPTYPSEDRGHITRIRWRSTRRPWIIRMGNCD